MSGASGRLAVGCLATAAAAAVGAGGAVGGAGSPTWRAAFAVAGFALLALAALRGRTRDALGAPSRGEAIALALAGWAFLLAVPWPDALARALAPYARRAHVDAGRGGGVRPSLDAGASTAATVSLVALVALAATLRAVVARGGRVALARAATVVALVHAVAALVRGRYAEDDPLLLGWAVRNASNAWGTFPTRTQAAAFLLLLLPGAVALVARPRVLADRLFGALTILAVVASVVGSGSRAGALGVACGLGVAALGGRRSRRLVAGVAAALVAGAVIARTTALEPVAGWLAPRSGEGTRFDIWAGTLDLVRRQPLGIGLEAFPYAYPGDGREPVDRWAGIAESDLLQLLAELGVVGAVGVVAAAFAARAALRADARAAGPDRCPRGPALAGLVAALPVVLTGSPLHAPAVCGAALVGWSLARGLVRGSDGAGPPGYRQHPSEAPWRAS